MTTALTTALTTAFALSLGVGLTACDGSGTTPPDGEDAGVTRMDGGGGEDAGESTGPTYTSDVRPILYANCVSCHVEGGIGPFPLMTYEETTSVGSRVEEATADRIMPPYLADNSGSCNTYSDYHGLSDEEIATIGAWVEAGMPEGDPSIPAPAPAEPEVLGRVDMTLTSPEYGIDTSVDDDYRCFIVDTGLTEATYVTGYEVRPGNLSRVHHVIVYNPASDAEVARARTLDADAPGEGYPCFGGPIVDASPLALWAPGGGAAHLPAGTGIEVAAGRPQIVQIHYNLLAGTGETDSTSIDFQVTDSAIPGIWLPMADLDLNLPPRTADVMETQTYGYDRLFDTVGLDQLHIYSVGPHMHTLGTQLNLRLVHADDSETCLLDIPRWDFNWQRGYRLSSQELFQRGDRVRIECHYNTMSRDEMVHWGDGTQDEMCLAFMYVSI